MRLNAPPSHVRQTPLRSDASPRAHIRCIPIVDVSRSLDLFLACAAIRVGTTLKPNDGVDRFRLAPREYWPLDNATGMYR